MEQNFSQNHSRRPEWLKVQHTASDAFKTVRQLIQRSELHTVCESARCPNIGECWGQHRTATFMILGDVCTRHCNFCAVKTGKPTQLDWSEASRVAEAVKKLDLKYAVVTSVTRDDLPDGGSGLFSATIQAIRHTVPDCRVEVLIPDFKGSSKSLKTVLDARPDVLNHNIETVPRLYPVVRPQANYQRSLNVIRFSKEQSARTKSGIMVGIGETPDEVFRVMDDLKTVGCDSMTIGQYLQPSVMHLPVDRYVTLEEFAEYKRYGNSIGFRYVESGPLVRSSYHAGNQKQ
jgi:lipoic acid synthetase